MSRATGDRQVGYGRLVAPLVLVFFAIGWYEFSAIYIQGANNQLVSHDNLSVYVTVQQVNGYMAALLDATYLTVFMGVLMFGLYLFKFLRARAGSIGSQMS